MTDTASTDKGPGLPHTFTFDVVGIGALNLDYIAARSTASTTAATPGERSMTTQLSDLIGQDRPLEWGIERQVDGKTIHAVIEATSSSRPTATLGGSAFNAICAIAETRLGLRLGYVGVAGRIPVLGVSALQQMDRLGIDRRRLREDVDSLCGICFSYSVDGDRTLLTHVGANDGMADYLEEHFDEVVSYLTESRIIHVTSFLDDRTAGVLLRVLRAVRRAGRENLISFDPGHVWSSDLTADVAGIIELADYLLLNSREFSELGRRSSGESDSVVAERLLSRLDSADGVVFVKHPTGVWSHRRKDGRTRSEFYAHAPLSDDEIEDATGAGDIFAAGLMIMLTGHRMRIEPGARLGMRLARHKLRHVGNSGHAQFAEVARDFIRSMDAERHNGT